VTTSPTDTDSDTNINGMFSIANGINSEDPEKIYESGNPEF
jgi:hypothetical protein